jgi:hypothetical protein
VRGLILGVVHRPRKYDIAETLSDRELRCARRLEFWLPIYCRVMKALLLTACVLYAFIRALNAEPPSPF